MCRSGGIWLNGFLLAPVLAPGCGFWNLLAKLRGNFSAELIYHTVDPVACLRGTPTCHAVVPFNQESPRESAPGSQERPVLWTPPQQLDSRPWPLWGSSGRLAKGTGAWLPRPARTGTLACAHSTFQMAIFPSSLPDPLSTYLSSAEHRAFTVSLWATSSFSTVFFSASIT